MERLNPGAMYEKVRWPNTTVTDELLKARKRIVFIFADRLARGQVTSENAKALTDACAIIRFHYNPSGYTSVARFNKTNKEFSGGYTVNNFRDKKSGTAGSFKDEMRAIFNALAEETGQDVDTLQNQTQYWL